MHTPEVGPVTESKFATDLLTVIFNMGIVFEPLVVIFLLYKPRLRISGLRQQEAFTIASSKPPYAESSAQNTEKQPLVTEESDVLIQALSLNRENQDKTIVRALSSTGDAGSKRPLLSTQTSSSETDETPPRKQTHAPMLSETSFSRLSKSGTGPIPGGSRRSLNPLLSSSRAEEDAEILEEAKAKLLEFEREAHNKLQPIDSSRHMSFSDEKEAETGLLQSTGVVGTGTAKSQQRQDKFWQVSKRIKQTGRASATEDETEEANDEEDERAIELSAEDRMALARLWVSDALNNREIKLHRIKGNPVLVYAISNSTTWRYVLYVVMFVQLFALPTMEPPSTWNLPPNVDALYPRYLIAILLDLLCNLFYTVDIGLQLYTYGLRELQIFNCTKKSLLEKRTFKSKRMHARIACWLVCITNVLVALLYRQAFRLDRILRPANVVFVSTTVLYLMRDLVLTFGDFLGVLLFYLFTIGWYAVVGAFIFDSQQYMEKRDADFGISPNSTEFEPAALYSVANPAILSLNLFVLSSLESYPDVFLPAYATQPVRSAFFFISFVIFSIIFLQSIAVPLVYLPFQKRQRKRVLEMKIEERKALVAAFEVLDVEGTQKLSLDTMRKLLEAHSSEEHIDLMLQILDGKA